MVNRLWCETVIPILWRNPWCYNINYGNKDYLFAIIASYLSYDIKEFLMKKGIQLPLISSQTPFFDYLTFCRSININTINIIISIGSSLEYNQFLLQQEIYSLFMKKFPGLKFLDMKSIKHQIFYYPEAKICLEPLCELKCDTSIGFSYFYGLASICQYIQRLTINNVNLKLDGIAKLIEVQKNLKYFEWKDDFDNNYYHSREDSYSKIFLELENKAETLNHFKIFFDYEYITGHMFPRNLLPKLYKLKTLVINDYIYIEDLSKELVYKDLEILNISYITIDEASIIIKNSGGKLKQILLKSVDYYNHFDDSSLNFIRNVYKNCPSIEFLSLLFSPFTEHLDEFEKLLNTCRNLKSLLLVIKNGYIYETEEKIIENGRELLKILIKSTTTNLRDIRFLNDFKFSLEDLKEFLSNWSGRPALSILTSDHIYESEDYKKLINKYKDAGVIKDFRCESITNIENMDFKI
ncbi:hypothetical protein RclHR1_00650002 [Rhizophagus clarus]|nr:hypothetical protein RclHR1_00650002 [Rhizophagus clarus]